MLPDYVEDHRDPGKFYYHNGRWWRYSKYNVIIRYNGKEHRLKWVLENDRTFLENYRINNPDRGYSNWIIDAALRNAESVEDVSAAEVYIPNKSDRVEPFKDLQTHREQVLKQKSRTASTLMSSNNRCQSCDGDGCPDCDNKGVTGQDKPTDSDMRLVRFLLADEQTHGKKLLSLIEPDEIQRYFSERNCRYISEVLDVKMVQE